MNEFYSYKKIKKLKKYITKCETLDPTEKEKALLDFYHYAYESGILGARHNGKCRGLGNTAETEENENE